MEVPLAVLYARIGQLDVENQMLRSALDKMKQENEKLTEKLAEQLTKIATEAMP